MTKESKQVEAVKKLGPKTAEVWRAAQATKEAASGELPEVINVSELSDASQDVLEHFGVEAPALLNQYANSVEDALLEQVERLRDYRVAISEIDIARKELDLENALLHRRLRLVTDLINRQQLDDINELMKQPL